jgi:hypothetical protein
MIGVCLSPSSGCASLKFSRRSRQNFVTPINPFDDRSKSGCWLASDRQRSSPRYLGMPGKAQGRHQPTLGRNPHFDLSPKNSISGEAVKK